MIIVSSLTAYNQMCIRAQNTDVEYYKYEKVEKKESEINND